MSESDKDSFNPFASPRVSERIPLQSLTAESEAKSLQRLPEKTLRAISHECSIADWFFLLSTISFQVANCPWYHVSSLIHFYLFIGYAVCTFVLWGATIAMTYRSKKFADLVMAFFVVPIPGFGALAFLAIRLGLWDMMVENGYKPRLISFSPDHAQRRAMAADPEYCPSLKFELDGSSRQTVFSLTEFTFFFGAIAILAPAIVIQL